MSPRSSFNAAFVLALCGTVTLGVAAEENPSRRYDIERGDAALTLKRFAEISGQQLVYMVDVVAGVRTHALHGNFTVRAALEAMIRDTGLVVVRDAKTGALLISRANAAPPPDRGGTGSRPHATVNSNDSSPMKPASLAARITTFATLLLSGTAPAAGQTAPTPQVADAAVELSPFEVRADRDVGYAAATTLSGSRLNTNLRDSAAAIQPFTAEQISDLSANTFEELTAYAGNLQLDYDDTAGGSPSYLASALIPEKLFRIRGLSASRGLDFFETIIPLDNYNAGRTEVSNGPNSILFGVGAPGGLINTSTQRAWLNRNQSLLKLSAGSWDYQRAEAMHNQVLVPGKLGLRLNAVWQDSNGWRMYDFTKIGRYSASLRWEPTNTTAVTANFERGSVETHISRPWNAIDDYAQWHAAGRLALRADDYATSWRNLYGIERIVNDGTTGQLNLRRTYYVENSPGNTAGAAYAFSTANAPGQRLLESLIEFPAVNGPTLVPANILPYEYSAWGPGSYKDNDFTRYFVRAEHRIGQDTVAELAFNVELSDPFARTPTGPSITLMGDPNAVIPNPAGTGGTIANPNQRKLYFDSLWGGETGLYTNRAARLAINHDLKLDGRLGRHRLAGMAERGRIRQQRTPISEVFVDENNRVITDPSAPEATVNRVVRRVYVVEAQPSTFVAGYPDSIASFQRDGRTYRSRYVSTLNGNDVTRTTNSFVLATQSYFWSDRLVVTAGYRQDDVAFEEQTEARAGADDPRVLSGTMLLNEGYYAGGVADSYHYKPKTKTLGGVAHVLPWLSFFYNFADNTGAPGLTSRILPDQKLPPPTRGVTDDYGVMLDLFGGKLNLRGTIFHTVQNSAVAVNIEQADTAVSGPVNRIVDTLNVSSTERLDHRLGDVGNLSGLADVDTKGVEIQATANLTRRFAATLAYSYTKVKRTNVLPEFEPWFEQESAYWERNASPTTAARVGIEVPLIMRNVAHIRNLLGIGFGNRPHKLTGTARYSFDSGTLKGTYLGGAVRWQDRPVMGIDESADRRSVTRVYHGAETFGLDAFLGYKLRLRNQGRQFTFQVNVRNLTDEPVMQPLRYNDGRTGYERVLLSEPRSFRFTVSTEF